MQDTTGSRAVGRGYRGTTGGTIAALGFVLAIVGSIGPWVANVVGSSGFQIQGKITAGIAVIGMMFLLFGRTAAKLVMLVAMCELALGGYEYEHVHSMFGRGVGWGVYAVIAGAILAAAGAAFAFAQSAG